MIDIPQEFINRMASEHEPRTKKRTTERIRREGLYKASNDELKDIGDDHEPTN